MTINWYQIFSAVITLLCTIITCVVVPWVKSKVSAENLAKAKVWVKIAVQSAEMIFNEVGKGKDKKHYVVEFVSKLLLDAHISMTYDEINNLIESAVLELKIKESVTE